MLNKDLLTAVFQNVIPATFEDSQTYLEQLLEVQKVLNEVVDVVNGIVESGGSGFILEPATSQKLGGVKIGEGVNVAEDGTISVDVPDIPEIPEYEPYVLPKATNEVLGGVRIGDNIDIDESSGTISVTFPDTPVSPTIELGQGLKLIDGKITLDLGQNLYFTEDGKVNAVASEPTVITTGIQESVNSEKTESSNNATTENINVNDSVYYEKY